MNTPLGRGFGSSRWSSPNNDFKVIYLGKDPVTSIAETVFRDRFEAVPTSERWLNLSEISSGAITEVRSRLLLRILDLTGRGAFALGVDADSVGAKAHAAGQAFSEDLHAEFRGIDGIMYPSRLTRGQCIAVYDRRIDRCLESSPAIGLEQLPDLGELLRGLNITLRDDLT